MVSGGGEYSNGGGMEPTGSGPMDKLQYANHGFSSKIPCGCNEFDEIG